MESCEEEGTGEASSRGAASASASVWSECIKLSATLLKLEAEEAEEARDIGGEDEGLDDESAAMERIDEMTEAAAEEEEEAAAAAAAGTTGRTAMRGRLAGTPATDEGKDTGSSVTSPASNLADTSVSTSLQLSGATSSPSSCSSDWLTNTEI